MRDGLECREGSELDAQRYEDPLLQSETSRSDVRVLETLFDLQQPLCLKH